MAEHVSYAGDHGILLARVFEAPRERVWKEWTEPESFSDWFGGDEAEIPIESVKMDVRVGGNWRATMLTGAERRAIHWRGRYFEVVEPALLVLTFSDNGAPDELVTVVLVDIGDGRTEMVFRQRGMMSGPQYEHAARGMSSFLDRIAQRLANE
jgi:uncharacterized protein YndB with AHSA1/START domain